MVPSKIRRMKIAIIGFGLIGSERVQALLSMRDRGTKLDILVFDPQFLPSMATDVPSGVRFTPTLQALLEEGPDWCVVATPHHVAPDICLDALATGAKVLIEKPLGISLPQSERLSREGGDRLWVGYNYRFFEGIAALWNDFREGLFGEPVCLRMTLGHGGAPDLSSTWKLNQTQVGGGCLLDPGTHLIDLAQVFARTGIRVLGAQAWRGFWNKQIDESAQVLLATDEFSISLDISIVRWRSTFSLECHGADGYGIVNGRGRSYGPQTYVRGKRWGWMGAKNQMASEELVLTSDCKDSFLRELEALILGVTPPGPNPCTAAEATNGMRLYELCTKFVEKDKITGDR